MLNSEMWMNALSNLIKDKSFKSWKIATYPESEKDFLASYEIQVGVEDMPDGESVTPVYSNNPEDFGFTYSDFLTEMDRLESEYDANQYQRDRQYPSIGDQLDMQYHDQLNGTTTWKDAIAKVKADNPKEAE